MLYECHGHLMMDGKNYKAAAARHERGVNEAALRRALCDLQKAGVTYFREGGDPFGVSLLAKKLAPEYGIRYASPVFAIHKKGHYGKIVGRAYDSMAEYLDLLRYAKERGADFIKIMISGIIDFEEYGVITGKPLEPSEIGLLINLAHSQGMAVMAHANTKEAVLAAAESGVDSIEHGCYADEACLSAMKANRVIFVPTLSAIRGFMGRAGFGRQTPDRIYKTHLELVSQAIQMGVPVAPGSDSGAYAVPHGQGAISEKELLLSCGETEEQLNNAAQTVMERFQIQ